MANGIKYSTTGDTQSIKKGNLYFGVGDVPKGPSSDTDYYNGITPVTGGYTVYRYEPSQNSKLAFSINSTGTDLVTYTNKFLGQSFTTATECVNWYNTQTNYVCVNKDYDSIITSGLTLCLDASFIPSYSTSGNSWYDLSYNSLTTTLVNGPTFDSGNGGSILFDAVDDQCLVTSNGFGTFNNQKYTIEAWVNFASNSGDIPIFSYDYSSFNNPYYSAHLRNTGTGQIFLAWNMSGFYYSIQTAGTVIFPNTWYYVVGIVESGRQQIYVNNNLWASGTISGTITFYNTPVYVGYFPNAPLVMNGKIAVVRVYNRAFSSSEVNQNWNAQKSRFGY